MTSIFLKYIIPTTFGFFAAWSAWYLFLHNGTSDFWTFVAILDLGLSVVAIVFTIGVVWLDL